MAPTKVQAAIAPAASNAAGGTLFVNSKDGTRIAYDKTGAGPPLVVVWGALGFKTLVFAKQMADELSKRFTVYNYDRRGRGDSGDTDPYSVPREIEDLAAICKAAGGTPFVFGTSSGAALALQAAAAGVPMNALVAWEPPYVGNDPKAALPADYRQHLEQLARENKRGDAVRYFMTSIGVPRLFVAMMQVMPVWKELKTSAHTLPYDAAVMGDFLPPTRTLAAIQVPTLVGSGEKSPPALRNAADAVAKALPHATRREIPHQNHGVKPKAIAPVIAEFCAQNKGR